MNPATDPYRTALTNEVGAGSATATTAVMELTGPLFQTRREYSRFDLAASAVAACSTMNAAVPAGVQRRYETGTPAIPAVAYRTSYANEATEASAGGFCALVLLDGKHANDRSLVARFNTLVQGQAAFNTASAAATGFKRYKLVIL